MDTNTTATSAYRTLSVVIDARGMVHTPTGVLLGDVDGMKTLGWEFAA